MDVRWLDLDFYKGKKVLVTGHTGFKGSWLCKILAYAGAQIVGYSNGYPTEPSLFKIANLENEVTFIEGDIRNYDLLKSVFQKYNPEIVFHLAAQPIVIESYRNPLYTYETNVMGTANILECIRKTDTVRSFLNITTDKVYKNNEWVWGYRESEELNGHDPYSNSKSCSELVTHSYKESFFADKEVAISTARAGNVIGGGDFAPDRIIPDCIRAVKDKKKILVRNPYSTRPYQHVLEPIMAYLMIAEKQYQEKKYAGSYNVGPDERDCVTTEQLVDLFCEKWGDGAAWEEMHGEKKYHEANFLKLDCSKLKSVFGWSPRWSIEECMEKICEWNKAWLNNDDIGNIMEKQIINFLGGID